MNIQYVSRRLARQIDTKA